MLKRLLAVSSATPACDWDVFAAWAAVFVREALGIHAHLEDQLRTRYEERDTNTDEASDQTLGVNASWAQDVLAWYRVHLYVVAQWQAAIRRRDIIAVPRLTREVMVDDLMLWAENEGASDPTGVALLQWHACDVRDLPEVVSDLYLDAGVPLTINFPLFAAMFAPERLPRVSVAGLTLGGCKLHTGRPGDLIAAGAPEANLWTVVTAGPEFSVVPGVRFVDAYAYLVTGRPHNGAAITVRVDGLFAPTIPLCAADGARLERVG